MKEEAPPKKLIMATISHYDEPGVGHLYYVKVKGREPPPYTKQREVRAIIDIAADGTLAGIELIDSMPPPPITAIPPRRGD